MAAQIFGEAYSTDMLMAKRTVLDFQCIKYSHAYYEEKCEDWDEYSHKYFTLFNNICNFVSSPENEIKNVVDSVC